MQKETATSKRVKPATATNDSMPSSNVTLAVGQARFRVLYGTLRTEMLQFNDIGKCTENRYSK